MQIRSVGIDLGKTTLHLVALSAAGKVLLRKKFTQKQLITFTANMQISLIGIEACSGAHFLGRVLRQQGHNVKLIPAQFVKPFVKSNKNDFLDAEAIAEAVDRQNMRFESRLEAAALMIALTFLGYVIFFTDWRTIPQALLYSLVPFLLWAALRFGPRGVSTSIVAIAFCSIWGAVHGRGPFTGPEPMRNVLSLQVFLIFAAAPFTLLAVVVEEREQARLVERELSKRLISEQEKERSRISSELHDDICQRLAMLSMELQKASSNENHLASATKQRLEEIRRHCSEITSDVQLLSHELHSAKIDYLGISAAIRGFCREFGEHQKVSVEFTARNVPKSVSRDESLCLFRVTQEALHNAVKHSGADRFWVELSGAGYEVRLEVKDTGIGFDVKEANRIGGLGLVSMQERVRAVNGRFYIESKPGAGTKIIVSVPAGTSSENAAKLLGAA